MPRNLYGFVMSGALLGTILWVVCLLRCLAGVVK